MTWQTIQNWVQHKNCTFKIKTKWAQFEPNFGSCWVLREASWPPAWKVLVKFELDWSGSFARTRKKKWSNAVIHNWPPKVTYIPTPLSWVGCGGSTSFSGVVESREHLRMWLSMHHYTVCSKQKIKKIAWDYWPDHFCFQIRTSFSQKMHRKIVVTKFGNGNKSYRTIGWVAKTKSILIQSYNWKNPRHYASYVTNFNSSCFFWAQSWWCNMKFSQ